jgi:phenylacetate-CoA ligase
MLDFLNRHVMHPLMARRARSRHLDYLRYLRQTQFDPPEVVRARQLAALKVQLRHAYDTVPYYRSAWRQAGVHPCDVMSLADLEAVPVLTKADIRKHEAELVSTAYDPAKLRVKRTSGSTGVPLTVRIDEPAVQWKTACTIRSDEWSGYRLGQRVAKVWGNPEYRHFGLKGRLRNFLFDRAVYLDTLNLTDDRIAEFARSIRRHRPGLIFGHAHSLYLLACSLKKSGVTDVRPAGIISTAMLLHDWQRTVIERVFDCPVTNRYGCEEVSLIASECELHQGLHVNADSVYTEVQAGDLGSPGKLLVTDLTNRAMPLVRYQIGDVVVGSGRACRCGRGLPMIERIEGREADYVVTPAGTLISGISLTENFALLITGTAQVQIVQESLHFLRVRLVADDQFGDASRRQIAKLVRDTFGPGVRHEVELVDAIPQEPSGKYRFCISHVAREHLEALSA